MENHTQKITVKKNPGEGVPLDDLPIVYVEQMTGLFVGPFVSKVILAVENPPNKPIQKIAIAMPTQSLHLLVKQINDILSTEETQKKFSDGFKGYQDSVRS